MSRKAIAGLAFSVLISLCVPSQAEEAKITIIRPPPLAVEIPPPREASVVTETHDNRSVNQAVAITIVTVANPFYGTGDRWWSNWNGRRNGTIYHQRGGPQLYTGPLYPF
jgi:hypothetical protein